MSGRCIRCKTRCSNNASIENNHIRAATGGQDRWKSMCEAHTKTLKPGVEREQIMCLRSYWRCLNNHRQPETPPDTLIETLSTLSILITRFPAHFSDPLTKPQPLAAIAPLLTHSRPAVRKRAILTLSQFFPVSPPELCNHLLLTNVLPNLEPNASLEQQRTTVNLVTAILRQSPQQLTTSLSQIIPGILRAIQRDDDELREGCLQVCIRKTRWRIVWLMPLFRLWKLSY